MALNIPILSSLDTKGFDKAAREFKALDTNSAKAGYAMKKAFLPAVAALGGLAVAAFGASGSISTGVYMAYEFQTRVYTNLDTTFKLRVTNSAGTVTPQAGSFYTVRHVSDTTGSFA